MWGTIIVAGILVVIVAAILFGMREKTVKVEKEAAVVTAVNVRVAIKSFSMYNERTWTIE